MIYVMLCIYAHMSVKSKDDDDKATKTSTFWKLTLVCESNMKVCECVTDCHGWFSINAYMHSECVSKQKTQHLRKFRSNNTHIHARAFDDHSMQVISFLHQNLNKINKRTKRHTQKKSFFLAEFRRFAILLLLNWMERERGRNALQK